MRLLRGFLDLDHDFATPAVSIGNFLTRGFKVSGQTQAGLTSYP